MPNPETLLAAARARGVVVTLDGAGGMRASTDDGTEVPGDVLAGLRANRAGLAHWLRDGDARAARRAQATAWESGSLARSLAGLCRSLRPRGPLPDDFHAVYADAYGPVAVALDDWVRDGEPSDLTRAGEAAKALHDVIRAELSK